MLTFSTQRLKSWCKFIAPLFILVFSISIFNPDSLQAQPAGFADDVYLANWNGVVGFTFDDLGRMYVWEKNGKVWVVINGVKQTNPVLDISDEVGNWRDFGLVGFALDPNFLSNGHIYLQNTVDRHHLINFGTPNYNANTNEYFSATIGRVTRYTASAASNFTIVNENTRKVLIGETKETGVPSLHESHGIGHLVFGEDGTLMVATGDGASYNSVDQGSAAETYFQQALDDGIIPADQNVGAYRSQMLSSLDGKLLRIDPETGNGVPSNPYYQSGNPRSAQSRVWVRGLRNPYRFCKKPGTGSHFAGDGNPGVFYVGDVGWGNREELNVVDAPGQNFGWPKFEGMTYEPGYNNSNYNPVPHERPIADWRNSAARAIKNGTIYNIGSSQIPGESFVGNASTGGVWYTGDDFPEEYKNTYFHADYGADWIRSFKVDENHSVLQVDEFKENAGPVVYVGTHPEEGSLYYVSYPNQIRKITYSDNSNKAPVARASANMLYGPGPMTVDFAGSNSYDPEGQNLSFAWNFGNGATSSSPNPSYTFPGNNGNPKGYTVTLTVTDPGGKSDQTTLNVAVNNTPPVINSTTIDNITSFNPNQAINLNLNANVSDAEHSVNVLNFKWEILLRHDNHFHAEPSIETKAASVHLSPIGCDGATYWYEIILTVTDPEGLSTSCAKNIFPNCAGINQTITFNPVTNKITTDVPFMPPATSNSGLPVQVVIYDGPAYLANGNVNLTGEVGVVTLIAIQSGNGTYAPAIPVIRSFEVKSAGSNTQGCSNLGSIVMEKWTGVPGFEVSEIPVNSTPNETLNLNIFEIPVNVGDNYGVRVRGYVCPPSTGNYKFWLSSDDHGQLFVSTDASAANKALVSSVPSWTGSREWDKFPSQQSANVYLIAGNKYYIEALVKENLGDDNLAVGWTLPNGTQQRPIPGNRLSPWDGGSNPTTGALVVEKGVAENVGSGWKTINLEKSFNSMVVATTVLMPNGSSNPAVTRIRNANASSFEIKVQNPSNENLSGYKVHYLVVEEGSYNVTDHGIKMEAFKFASPLTSNTGAWSTENLSQSNSYSSPVVLGQVQSYHDPDWSTFWAASQSSNYDPPTNNNIGAGKHVGEDSDKLRASETIGVIILEAGSGTLDGDSYVAALGAKSVGGFEGAAGFSYSISGIPQPGTVVGSISSMAGTDGGWAVLYGNGAVSPGQLTWAIDEDQIANPERTHTVEHVAYIVFNDGTGTPLQNQSITFPTIANKLTTDGPFQLNATASSGLAVTYAVVSGPASVAGNTVTLNGTAGSVTVRASQGGNGSYHPAPNVDRTFTVSASSAQNQTITFPVIPNKLTTDGPFPLNATASSGLSVTYTLVSGPASVAGNTITLNGAAGAVTVRAAQAGNGSYNPAPNVNRTFTVSEPTQGGEYCASTSAQPWTEWISNVSFSNIDNSSSKCGSTCGYSDYTNIIASVDKGTSYDLTVTPGLSWPGHQPDLFWHVWIDFNGDGDFIDAGEQVLESNNGNQGASTSVTIPSTAASGLFRIRVSLKRDGYSTPCESFAQGEVEDYGINIQGGTTGCSNVTSPGSISGDENHCGTSFDPAAMLSSSNASGGSGSVQYRWQVATSSSTGPWTSLSVSQNTYNPGTIGQTSWYRRQAKSSTCTTWLSSNVVVKIVDPNCSGPGEYCSSTSAQPWTEWIQNVAFASIDNSSSKCGSTCGYSDFTNLVATVNKGASYDLTVTPGLSWPGHQPDLFWHVWIDFNGDGDFMDAGEQVLESNNGNQGATTSVTIPTSAAVGTFRIRVSLKRDAYSDPCESFAQGEVEDYAINIVDGIGAMLVLDGERMEEAIRLHWVTTEEESNSYFELERSSDGIEYQPLYQVDSEFDLPGSFEYTKVDESPLPGRNFYRVKEYMDNGSFRLSSSVTVYYSPRENDVLVFPNPAVDILRMSTPYYAGKSAFIIITNNLGQVVYRQEVAEIPITPIEIDLSDFQNGLHTVSMKIGEQKMLSGQFVVAKGY